MNIWREILRGVRPGQYSDRAIRERREASRGRCICPSHASNHGQCPIHDAHGRVRPGYPIVVEAPHTTIGCSYCEEGDCDCLRECGARSWQVDGYAICRAEHGHEGRHQWEVQ